MTIPEIRQLHDKELLEELTKSYRELMKAKMDLINGSSKEMHGIKKLKKHIARLKTIQHEVQKSNAAKVKEAPEAIKTEKAEPVKKTARKSKKTTN